MSGMIRPWGPMHFQHDGPDLAPAILWVKSLGTDLRIWGAVVAQFRGWREVVFNNREHGVSTIPDSPRDTADLAADSPFNRQLLGDDEKQAAMSTSFGALVAARAFARGATP